MAESTTIEVEPKPQGKWSIRQLIHGSHEDFTTGSIHRAVGLLAVPMVVEMAGESIFALTDAFYIEKLGSHALASVGLTESMLELVYAIAIGLGMATTALVARRIGEKDEAAAGKIAGQAILLSLILAIVLGISGAFFAPNILSMMGASQATVDIGVNYTRVIYGSMFVVILLFVNNAIFRGAGDAATAMRALWIANIINIILDPCLIFGLGPFPELGLTGAAIATTIGRGTGVVYQFWCLSRGTRVRVTWADLRFVPTTVMKIVQLSAGGVGQMLIATASYVGLIRILATFGESVLAGYVVSIRIVIFIILPAWGVSNAAATLVGQNLGAKKPDRAEKSVWITGMWNMLFMAIVTIGFVLFADEIIRAFTANKEISAIAAQSLRIISYGYIFYAWGMVMMQAFNGAGDTTTPTIINLICFWMFQIPLAWIVSIRMDAGPQGVFWAIALSYSLSAIIGVVLFRRGKWKTRVV